MGYEREIAWQESLDSGSFSECDLLRESAWVILCSGFREAIVRRRFSYLSTCFLEWESSEAICKFRAHCRTAALSKFSSPRKIDAIIKTAEIVNLRGFNALKHEILARPIETLQVFPFIGGITAYHLAKNIGISVAKPDRYLQRIARFTGYNDVQILCGELAQQSGDSIQVVDSVLWRYCERLQSFH
jgi:hypothetical protein